MRDKRIIVIIILIILLGGIIYLYQKEENTTQTNNDNIVASEEEESTTTTEAQVEKIDIINTISSQGEIKTALTEKIPLHATYYLSECYVEEGEKIEEGKNILKYTNGTYLIAPYNLVIKSIDIPELREQCTNNHYIEVNATDTLSMTLNVEEDSLDKISIGQEVEITPNINDDEKNIGYITNISNTGTYSSKGSSYEIIVTFENEKELKIGMSAKADIILEKVENVLAVPNEAIYSEQNQKYVILISNGTTQKVNIETGISNDAYTQIKSGLEEGQTIQLTKSETTNTTRMENRGMMKSNEQQGKDMEFDGTPPSKESIK